VNHATRTQARRRALQALYQWQMTSEEVSEILAQFLTEQEMSRTDIAYFQELVRGVTKRAEELDALLAEFVDRPIRQIDPVERAILRLGSYELLNHFEIPYRAVINEAIRLAKDFGAEQGHRYVNSVLDRVARKVRAAELGPKAPCGP
jgi:N utilization substance protein B